jgi:hypothetical protein
LTIWAVDHLGNRYERQLTQPLPFKVSHFANQPVQTLGTIGLCQDAHRRRELGERLDGGRVERLDAEGELAVARNDGVDGIARAGVPVDDRPPHAEAVEHRHEIVLGALGCRLMNLSCAAARRKLWYPQRDSNPRSSP